MSDLEKFLEDADHIQHDLIRQGQEVLENNAFIHIKQGLDDILEDLDQAIKKRNRLSALRTANEAIQKVKARKGKIS